MFHCIADANPYEKEVYSSVLLLRLVAVVKAHDEGVDERSILIASAHLNPFNNIKHRQRQGENSGLIKGQTNELNRIINQTQVI